MALSLSFGCNSVKINSTLSSQNELVDSILILNEKISFDEDTIIGSVWYSDTYFQSDLKEIIRQDVSYVASDNLKYLYFICCLLDEKDFNMDSKSRLIYKGETVYDFVPLEDKPFFFVKNEKTELIISRLEDHYSNWIKHIKIYGVEHSSKNGFMPIPSDVSWSSE